MRSRSIVSIVTVVLWVLSQAAMAFANVPESAPAAHGTEMSGTITGVHQMTDCVMHAQPSAHTQHEHGAPDSQHAHQDMTDCCEVACSLVYGAAVSDLKPRPISKTFNMGRLDGLVAITIDLTTPPPNTTS